MTESLLHFIWKFQLFKNQQLATKAGEAITVINPGWHNHNSGPDFLNAKVKIGEHLWSGNIELHLADNEWKAHNHHTDPAYNNVILHITHYSQNEEVAAQNGAHIPNVELKNHIEEKLLQRYELLMRSAKAIPCAEMLHTISTFTITTEIEKRAIGRLENKVSAIENLLRQSANDWEHVAWQLVARYLGGSVNREAMEQVMKNLSVSVLSKHANNVFQIEAMLFGVAGLLHGKFADEYPRSLQREFAYLKKLHALCELEAGVIRWAKIRPAAFPSIRLAQLAALMHKNLKLFSELKHIENLKDPEILFEAKVSSYWQHHFRFDEPAAETEKPIGDATVKILLINAAAPLLFAYGKHKGEASFCDRALQMLQMLKPESNRHTKVFGTLNITPANALQSQGLIELKENYCDKFQCLSCSIGAELLRK